MYLKVFANETYSNDDHTSAGDVHAAVEDDTPVA